MDENLNKKMSRISYICHVCANGDVSNWKILVEGICCNNTADEENLYSLGAISGIVYSNRNDKEKINGKD